MLRAAFAVRTEVFDRIRTARGSPADHSAAGRHVHSVPCWLVWVRNWSTAAKATTSLTIVTNLHPESSEHSHPGDVCAAMCVRRCVRHQLFPISGCIEMMSLLSWVPNRARISCAVILRDPWSMHLGAALLFGAQAVQSLVAAHLRILRAIHISYDNGIPLRGPLRCCRTGSQLVSC